MAAVLSLLSALMWGTADFLGGVTARKRSAVAIYLGSQAFGFVLLLAVALIRGDWHSPLGYLWWGIGLGITGLVAMIAFYRALALGPMGLVSPLVAVAVVVPVIVGFASGEIPSPMEIAGIVIAFIGVLLASGPEITGAESMKPLIYTGVAAVGFGLLYVGMAKGSETSPSMTMLTYRATSMVILLVALIISRSSGGITKADVPVLAAIGILDASANLLFGIASTLGMLSTTSVLSSLYPVVTAVLAAIVLRERLRPIQYAGVTVAMVGVVLLSAGGI
ncbi:MAG: EamA family transporter [Candidatus Nanopelagicales bacterium]